MRDLRTSITGGVSGVCQLLGMFFPGIQIICDPLSALALALLGWYAKDR